MPNVFSRKTPWSPRSAVNTTVFWDHLFKHHITSSQRFFHLPYQHRYFCTVSVLRTHPFAEPIKSIYPSIKCISTNDEKKRTLRTWKEYSKPLTVFSNRQFPFYLKSENRDQIRDRSTHFARISRCSMEEKTFDVDVRNNHSCFRHTL